MSHRDYKCKRCTLYESEDCILISQGRNRNQGILKRYLTGEQMDTLWALHFKKHIVV